MHTNNLEWTSISGPTGSMSSGDTGGVFPTVPPAEATFRRRRLLHRSTLTLISRALDVLVLTLITLGMSFSEGVDLITSPVFQALPLMIAPAAAFAGATFASGRKFAYAGSISVHLFRIALGSILGVLLWIGLLSLYSPSAAIDSMRIGAAASAAMIGLHANYLGVVRSLTRAGALSDNVVIIGATSVAAEIVRKNAREKELNILGYFDDRVVGRVPPSLEGAPFLGGVDDLLEWPRLPEVDRIIITVTSTAMARVRHLIDQLRNLPQEIILVLDLEGFNPETTSLARVANAPAAYVSGAPRDIRRATIKRAADVVIAACACLIFLIPCAVIALLIRLDSPGTIFFRQKRHGFNNEIINVWKFRTMRPDLLAQDGVIRQTQANDPRVTRIGRFLRASSLDELPQLFNVLRGEMSLVGPRPHAVGMTAGATKVTQTVGGYAHRHRMKPGITGWAQINGSRGPVHTEEEVRERVRLDLEYIARATLWLDLYILVMTIPRLLGDRERAR